MTMNTIEDALPGPDDANYIGILRCTRCGNTGQWYSNHPPDDRQYWDCDECNPEHPVKHEFVIWTANGVAPDE